MLSFRRLLTFLGQLSRRVGRNSFPFHRFNGENSRHLNNLDAIFSYNSWRTFDYSIFNIITILLCNRSSEDCNSHNMADEWRKKDWSFAKCFRIMPSFFCSSLLSRNSRCILNNNVRIFFNSRSRFVCVRQQPLLFKTIPSKSLSQVCCRSWSSYAVRRFHTSQSRSAAPLAVLLVKLAGPLSKLTKLVAVVGGR